MVSAPDVLSIVHRFVDDEVRRLASALEHADEYPHALAARMRQLRLFGAVVPAEYGGLGLDVTTDARIIEAMNQHPIHSDAHYDHAHHPACIGDTIYCESTVLAKREPAGATAARSRWRRA